jgi:hypothetical protein
MAPRRDGRLVGAGTVLVALGLGTIAVFDRPGGGTLFLVGVAFALEGLGQFHPLFALLFPFLTLLAAATDAARGLPLAALTWFVGAALLIAQGRLLRRRRRGLLVRPNHAVEALTGELAALQAQHARGEITEDEFRARRDAAVHAFREGARDRPPSPAAPESP